MSQKAQKSGELVQLKHVGSQMVLCGPSDSLLFGSLRSSSMLVRIRSPLDRKSRSTRQLPSQDLKQLKSETSGVDVSCQGGSCQRGHWNCCETFVVSGRPCRGLPGSDLNRKSEGNGGHSLNPAENRVFVLLGHTVFSESVTL